MPLDSKQQIYNDLEYAFLYYPNFDLKNNIINIYSYMDPIENEIANIINQQNIISLIREYAIPLLGPNPSYFRTVIFKTELESSGYPVRNRCLEFYEGKQRLYRYNHIGNSHIVNYDKDKNVVYFEFGNDQYSYVVCYHLKSIDKSYLLVTKYEYESVFEKYKQGSLSFDIEIN